MHRTEKMMNHYQVAAEVLQTKQNMMPHINTWCRKRTAQMVHRMLREFGFPQKYYHRPYS